MHSQTRDSLQQRIAHTDPDTQFWREAVTEAFAKQLGQVEREFAPDVLLRCLDIVDEFTQKSKARKAGLPITCAPTTFTSTSTTVSPAQVVSLPPATSLPVHQSWGLVPLHPSPNVTPRTSSTPSSTPLHTSAFLKDFMGPASPSPSQRSLHTPQLPDEQDM